ncbi:DUF3953 domain-containing protein [Peribacillus frigoritolerans]|uniref:DUF3953 domain-containing protein n=1 Tax=Peribacillus frigoritolerans TaxID=450367 RepID=UPI00227DBB4C|nr:DUF3953 domain-containing protein [Peribacillus frigoritolerans]MCY9140261.1 DUF3953 domain-containing protein [Peribacillus frigoritolerans]
MVRVILAIVVIILTGNNRITETELVPYYMFFLGALILVTGLSELQKDRKGFWGHMNIVISLFIFLVSIQGFLLNYRVRLLP